MTSRTALEKMKFPVASGKAEHHPDVLAPADLEQAIRDADPDAFLVEARILRRVVRQDRGVGMLGRHAIGRRGYAIDGQRALAFLDLDELGLPSGIELPETLILIARPDPSDLASLPAEESLLDAWRVLAPARVQATLKRRVAEGTLDLARIHQRIDRIGQAEFDEIRSVLRQEHYLQDARDPITSYVEFASLFAELRYFAPEMLPRHFPSLGDPGRIDTILAEDLDIPGLLAHYRPPGAPDLPEPGPVRDDEDETGPYVPLEDEEQRTDLEPRVRTRWLYRFLVRKANQAAARGNHMRAAIRRIRAARFAPVGREESTREAARRELERLAQQLVPALGLRGSEVSQWRRALPPLASRAGRGIWSREARLLYDLQKVVLDHGREIYTVDLVEWALSMGQRPIKRPLPFHREVLIGQHLFSARRRLAKVRLPEVDRDRLAVLLHTAVDRSKQELREVFRPVVAQTLAQTGWVPSNLPEQVALEKLTEELLDRVVDRGFLSMGDLRDAVSRSKLKLPDLAGIAEFWHGDRLLRTDRALAVRIDGVYRRGEVYLRWLQRMSSLGFGTRFGRLVTLYITLPFGGAYVLLHGLDHLIHLAMSLFGKHIHVHLFHTATFIGLGFLLIGLVNSLKFRQSFVRSIRQAATKVRTLLIDVPAWVLDHPVVRAIVNSRPFKKLTRWVVKPLLFTLPTLAVLAALDVTRADTLLLGAVAYAAAALMLNSRAGRDAEEILADRAVRFWQRLRRDFIPGVFRLIMETFDRLLETVERILYAIDEWLRFKSGQGPIMLAGKAVIGLAWFFITYLVRFGVNLVIEPQVNPIKHFPMVTVAHKVLFPVILAMYKAIQAPPCICTGTPPAR